MEYSPTHADELRGSFEGVVRVVQAADEVEDVPWHVHEVRQQVVTPRRGRGRRRGALLVMFVTPKSLPPV